MPDVDQVAWPLAGGHQYGVYPHIFAVFCESGRKLGGGVDYAIKAIAGDGFGGLFDSRAMLHFDEGDRFAALGDEIDFAGRATRARLEHAIPFEAQQPGRAALGLATGSFGGTAVQSFVLSSARA